MRVVLALAAGVLASLCVAGTADASYIVDRNATDVALQISGDTAIVNYTSGGKRRHVLLSGAVNALPPVEGVRQVAFHVRRGRGSRAGGTCRKYTGPRLVFLVAACDGPDGSYWALQAWTRLEKNFGGSSAPSELHASHWTGALPKLQVWLDWTYHGRLQHLFGRFIYDGTPVYGFRASHGGAPLDPYGRNVYVDTLNSAYGRGWHRENSFLTHKPTGTFCYEFTRHGGRFGTGSAYRVTAQGPGVTPIVQWKGKARRKYNARIDKRMNAKQRSLGDPLCTQN